MSIVRRVSALAAGAVLLVALASCAQAVAGQGVPGSVPCVSADGAISAARAATPTGEPDPPTPVITVDPGTNLFISNWHTLPMYLTVYPDGAVIRADGVGMHQEPLPRMTIGRIDDCVLERAIAELVALAEQNMGDPRITDQSTTRVVLRQPGDAPLTVSAYALGLGDEYVEPAQAAARARLSATIDALAAGMTGERAWTPDRLRLTWFDTNQQRPGPRPIDWPLDEPIDAVFDGYAGDRYPCVMVEGIRAAAMLNALGTQPVVSPWSDGSRVASIAVGIIVPGQEGCPER